MPQKRSFVDFVHYTSKRDYNVTQGNVSYLDGRSLARPFDMPLVQKLIAAVFVVVAVCVGGYFINTYVLAPYRDAANAQHAIADNLSRQPSIETIPNMASLVNLGDDEIRALFEESGYTVFDATAMNESSSMTLYKLPEDVSVEEAATLYAKGVSSLTASQATKLLNGSWYFDVDRTEAPSMVVRYSDFSTDDPEIAVQSALAKQGIDPASMSENGIDESGNTYAMGGMDVDGTNCLWKISALELSDMYSVSGLPEDACYVGIRFTVQ